MVVEEARIGRRLREKREERRTESTKLMCKECIHFVEWCDGVMQEKDVIFFFFFLSRAKAKLTKMTSPKTLCKSKFRLLNT